MERGSEQPWQAYWPVLLGPATLLWVYVAHALGWRAFLAKGVQETTALALLGSATALFAVRVARARHPTHLLLGALSLAFLCREIHFAGTGRGVYVALVLLALWAWRWRERLAGVRRAGRLWPWLAATGFTYLLSQLIARRAFRHVLPIEAVLHVPLEEAVENAAHAMLLVCAFADRFGRARQDKASRVSTAAANAGARW